MASTKTVEKKAAEKNGGAFRDAVPRWDVEVDASGRKQPGTEGQGGTPLFMKGNEAVVHGALLAGCRCFFGYPITPASEIAHTAAALFPRVGGVFLQAESEIAAIQMVYGAAGAGLRAMTASSSPGISLKQEGLSYAAGAELPLVVVDIMRGGPGLGNIAPEQADYFQMVKGGGHGNYRMVVLAPNSAQEMCDFTMEAFEIADRYRNPVAVIADGVIGQIQEPVYLPSAVKNLPDKTGWSVQGNAETRKNLVSSIFLDSTALEGHVRHLHAKYQKMERAETRWEEFHTEDADVVLVGYGVVSRILHGAVEMARREGLKAGLLRPITVWPFPSKPLRTIAERAKGVLAVELSTGQMVEDVRLAAEQVAPVHFLGHAGGVLPTVVEVLEEIRAIIANPEEVRS
jgi:pyruvate/2-oxoacid:ferredoxin oxidoreductase alpha subunit